MNCQKCNKEITNESKFCKYCGANNEQIITTQNLNPSTTSNTIKKTFDFRILGWIIFIIIMIVGGYYGSIDNKAKEKNQKGIDILETSDDKRGAISSLTEASETITNTDDKITILKNLAFAYIAEGQYDNAVNKFNEALALCEKDSFNYYLISGDIASLLGKLKNALDYYNKAYALEPEDGQINTSLCLFYLGDDDPNNIYTDYNKALPFCQKAYGEDSDSETTKENLAFCYFYLKDFTRVIPLIKQTSLNNKGYNNYVLGLAYYATGDGVNAKIYLKKAISMGTKVEPEIYDYVNE